MAVTQETKITQEMTGIIAPPDHHKELTKMIKELLDIHSVEGLVANGWDRKLVQEIHETTLKEEESKTSDTKADVALSLKTSSPDSDSEEWTTLSDSMVRALPLLSLSASITASPAPPSPIKRAASLSESPVIVAADSMENSPFLSRFSNGTPPFALSAAGSKNASPYIDVGARPLQFTAAVPSAGFSIGTPDPDGAPAKRVFPHPSGILPVPAKRGCMGTGATQ